MNDRWQQIERIFHAARELDASMRMAFLAKACGEDSDLHREVESLLVQADQHESFLDSPALQVAAGAMAKKELFSKPQRPKLDSGTMIAHYRLAGKIGEGGMGEVYRARDTKLQRDVALKILPQAMAHDAERMARFEREAQVLASLNHPNIAAIHGLEESNGIHALVMELVEGETLEERIGRDGPSGRRTSTQVASGTETPHRGVSTDEALPIAKQIAEALEYAHERGVIHRDLKPANVKITPEGTVKVLDFGLAKVMSPRGSSAKHEAANSPTLTTLATQPGMLLGTASYMSPEQARGQKVDRRCDIWAFGCVLFEMFSGRKAFDGETISDVLAAVIKGEPNWAAIPEKTPQSIQILVRRCLQKDQRQRLRDIGDARITIEEVISGAGIFPESALEPITRNARPDSQRVGARARFGKKGFFGGLAVGVMIALVVAYLQMPPLPPPKVSRYIKLTHDGVPKELVGTDGSRLYLMETVSGRARSIAQVSVAGGDVARISPPSPGLHALNAAPDGSDLLFVNPLRASSQGTLWAAPILGGPPRRLADAIGYDGAWSADKKKLVYARASGLYVANGNGTEARKIASLPGRRATSLQVGGSYLAGAWSPDGHQIRFTILDPSTQIESIWQVSADGEKLHPVFPGWHTKSRTCCGKWTPDGKYFVFQSQGQIWASRETGDFIHKASHKPVQITFGTADYSTPLPSKDGSKLFAVAGFPRAELERYDTKTRQFLPFLSGISASGASFTRDRQRVAYVTYPEGSLWLSKADGSQRLQLTFPPMTVAMPRWSPDGGSLAFMGQLPNMPWQVYVISADGGSPRQVTDGTRNYADQTWSPDGSSLILGIAPWDTNPGKGAVYELNLRTGEETQLPGSDAFYSPSWSPDGRYVAALAPDAAKMLLFDFTSQKWTELTSLALQGWEEWSHDGDYVYFWGVSKQGERGIHRVRISDRKIEKIVSLQDFQQGPGLLGGWVGVAPDNSPLLVKDTGTQEVVAMDWTAP